MEKILPPPDMGTAMNPMAVIKAQAERIAFMDHMITQHQNISIILAMELLRNSGSIQENMIVAPGRSALNIIGPMSYVITQKRINQIEHLYMDGPPTIQMSQTKVGDDDALVVMIKSISEAEQDAAKQLN